MGGGEGVTFYNGISGQALPERGTFFMLQGHKWKGNFLVYERLGTSVISVCKRAQRTVKKYRKTFWFCDLFIIILIKDSAFTAVEMDVMV